jgi:hypothetical protein
MNIYQPFTYLIKFKPTGQVYYGVRYARKCNPSQLWTTYFTTSKIIKQLIKEYGISAFEFQIRRVFNTTESAVLWESKILKRFNAATNPLWLNQNNGDRKFVGSRIWTDQQKQILSQKLTGRTISNETRSKLSVAHKGKSKPPISEETRAKLKIAANNVSNETRTKISNSLKGHTVSTETRAKIGAANTGKTHTVETKAKLSVARKGKPLSAEHRAKISASSKVRPPVSDETRAKISAAKRKNHKFL